MNPLSSLLLDCLRLPRKKTTSGTRMAVQSHCQLLPTKLLPFCQGVPFTLIFYLHSVSPSEMIGCWESPVIELTSKAGSEVLKTTASIRCETSTGSTFTSPASLTSLMFCFNSSIELDVDGLRTSSMSVESFHRISLGGVLYATLPFTTPLVTVRSISANETAFLAPAAAAALLSPAFSPAA